MAVCQKDRCAEEMAEVEREAAALRKRVLEAERERGAFVQMFDPESMNIVSAMVNAQALQSKRDRKGEV